ncbi:MAG: iron-sulfur cluster carrier protein ApbC, partial [Gammaproteobacteria bacterium]
MSSVSRDQVESAIKQYIDPYLESDLVTAKSIKNIAVDNGKVSVDVSLGFPAKGYYDKLTAKLKEQISALDGVSDVTVNVSSKVEAHATQKGVKPIDQVKNIIAVASGKGGVGKSTTAVNLALALAAEGANVGILDADIYGPSQPRMLGVSSKPESPDGKSLEPLVGHGIQSMSIGYLIDEETPMIWRGPMVTQALEQLLNDTNWKDVDYLIIDLPPGTGDIQLTLAQKVPVSGAVIVTTPQDIALLDARKALKMFEKVDVHVLGIIENMSIHICSNCGHEEHIFGEGGGQSMSKQYDVDFLGALPLDKQIREEVDSGRPTVAVEPDSRISEIYREIARQAAAKLSKRAKEH